MAKRNPHIGSSFDSLLEETGELAEVNSVAIKRVVAWEIEQLMKQKKITKSQMAKRMNTSRTALDRLLDPQNTSVTLRTLDGAACALGKKLYINFA